MILSFALCGISAFWGLRLYFHREGWKWILISLMVSNTIITLDYNPSWNIGGVLWLGFTLSLALPLAMMFSPFHRFSGPDAFAHRTQWTSRNMIKNAVKEAWSNGWDIYIDDYTQEVYTAPKARHRLYTERVPLADNPPKDIDDIEASWMVQEIWVDHFEYFGEGK